jgi:hypothetical protein
MPSSSKMSVSASAQISSNRCQSVELRARRETSRPITNPTRPSPTSATSRWKPDRASADAPERPKSSSITTSCSGAQPSARARRWRSYCRAVLSR